MPNHVHLVAAALGRTHWRYTRRVNFGDGCRGWLWQGRFASCPLDREHARAAVRYVELNPVRAGLARRPEEYAWSSARFHVLGERDGLTMVSPVTEEVGDWREYLGGGSDGEAARLRRSTSTGRPLGSPDFVARLERELGRPLAPGRPGRKPAGGGK